MNKQRLEKVEEKIMKELEFYTNDEISLEEKKKHLDISIVINKLANTIIQSENIIERSKQNDINFKENQRLINRFNKE